ncbi:MAG: hypothetical protein P8168_01715 [Deltaproteobacteria bacterium]|jgi:prefoldin subunit 5
MSARLFRISGQVIEVKTKKGISGLRVETWDQDGKIHDPLGGADTDTQGNFTIPFDEAKFRELFPETPPDVFFRVFQGETLLMSTENELLVNVGTDARVTLEVDLPAEAVVGQDRITARQALRTADFVFRSDFRGVWKETTDKIGLATGFFRDMVKNTLTQMDIPPLRTSPQKTDELVNRDVATAQENLKAQQIAVNQVVPYKPGLNAASVADLRTFPARLAPGQKVNLYEEKGVVRYYSIVTEPAGTASAAAVSRLSREVNRVNTRVAEVEQVKSQVEEVKTAAATDRETYTKEIADLKNQVSAIEGLKKEIAALKSESSKKDLTIKKLQKDIAASRRTG